MGTALRTTRNGHSVVKTSCNCGRTFATAAELAEHQARLGHGPAGMIPGITWEEPPPVIAKGPAMIAPLLEHVKQYPNRWARIDVRRKTWNRKELHRLFPGFSFEIRKTAEGTRLYARFNGE